MRLLNRLAMLAALTPMLAIAAATAAPKTGAPAPLFSATNSQGQTVKLADYRGKFVVLEWTNDGCPFVQKHYQGNMQSLQQDATTKGAVWLSVISSAPGQQGHVSGAQADALSAARKAAPSAVLLDSSGDLGRLYEAKTTPHMYIVDPKGALIYAGGIDSIASADPADIPKAKPYVKTALAEAMAGKSVGEPLTKPYGCSVKY